MTQSRGSIKQKLCDIVSCVSSTTYNSGSHIISIIWVTSYAMDYLSRDHFASKALTVLFSRAACLSTFIAILTSCINISSFGKELFNSQIYMQDLAMRMIWYTRRSDILSMRPKQKEGESSHQLASFSYFAYLAFCAGSLA